jgi:ubiquinone/menaquinone biosynthesis C-methylase UbiE
MTVDEGQGAVRAAYEAATALEAYSVYTLHREERYIFSKYFRPGDSVLDLACGMGRTTLRLYELGMRVKGVDLSRAFIQAASKRFPYLTFEVGSFTDIQEPAAYWDHVFISFNSLDCAPSEDARLQALRECHRVLKPGGTFVFSSHHIRSLFASPSYLIQPHRWMWILKNLPRAFREKDFILDPVADQEELMLFFGSRDYVIRQTEKIGFQYLEKTGVGLSRHPLLPEFLSPYIHYVFRKPA